MKQFIRISFALLFVSIIITSCKKSSSNNSIVGSWELASAHIVTVDSTTTPITVTTQDTTVAHGHSEVISFFADNTVTQYDFSVNPPTVQSPESYIVVGDSLTLFSGSTGITVHYTIGGNLLTLFVSQSSPGSSVSITEKLNRLQ
ncbi:MAG TPA: hypothetical protein VNW06_06380 [Cytophagaceae bacterium]|jgi:hypothetical protein|nr:hypothetical protein [Cytophagaceae bacterium]